MWYHIIAFIGSPFSQICPTHSNAELFRKPRLLKKISNTGKIQMRNGAEIKKWYFFCYQAVLWGRSLTRGLLLSPLLFPSLSLFITRVLSVGYFSDSSAFSFKMSATSFSSSVFMPGFILIFLSRVSAEGSLYAKHHRRNIRKWCHADIWFPEMCALKAAFLLEGSELFIKDVEKPGRHEWIKQLDCYLHGQQVIPVYSIITTLCS